MRAWRVWVYGPAGELVGACELGDRRFALRMARMVARGRFAGRSRWPAPGVTWSMVDYVCAGGVRARVEVVRVPRSQCRGFRGVA